MRIMLIGWLLVCGFCSWYVGVVYIVVSVGY